MKPLVDLNPRSSIDVACAIALLNSKRVFYDMLAKLEDYTLNPMMNEIALAVT